MSKGSRDRTKDVDKFQENFDRIFKKNKGENREGRKEHTDTPKEIKSKK